MYTDNLKSAINAYSTKPATRGFFDKYEWLESVAWKACGEDALTVRLNGFTWEELSQTPRIVNWFSKSGAAWAEVLPVIAELDRPMWRESQPDLTFTAWRNGTLQIATGGVRW